MMKYSRMMGLVFGIILAFACIFANADTMYIGNKDAVILRDSATTKGSIVQELKKGEAVKLLKSNLENGYSFVRTPKGAKGWMRTKYLVQQKPGNKKSSGFFSGLWYHVKFWGNNSKAKLKPLPKKVNVALPKPVIDQQTQKIELAAIKRLQQIEAQLTEQIQQVQAEQTALRQRSNTIKHHQKSNQYWFIAGAIIALLGVWLGYLVGGSRKRRRDRFFH